jgi:hypothetical protein
MVFPAVQYTAILAAPRRSCKRAAVYMGCVKEPIMNEDVFNNSIRKFLKTLGVSAQREIEKAVRAALADGKLKGHEKFPAKAVVTLAGLNFSHEITGEIELG